MLDRLDLKPLLSSLVSGLKKRRTDEGIEPADWPARVVLFGMPVAVAAALVVTQVRFAQADQLLAACALLAGALLTGFAQVASWRERILGRHRRVDGIDTRALNEAAAHILVSLLVSLILATAVFVLANIDLAHPSDVESAVAIGLSALGGACLCYIAISLLIVVNLLWDAFQNEERESRREGLQG